MTVDTIVKAKKLIGGAGFSIVDDPVIGIANGIVAYVDSGRTTAHEGRTIDLKGSFLLPGFVDTHVHFVFGSCDTRDYEQVMLRDTNEIMLLRASQNALSHLRKGVTTVRDLGDRDGTMVSLRNAINRGILQGPRMVVAGPPLTTTGGHFHFCNGEVDGQEEIRKKIRSIHKLGADVIKIMASGGTTRGSAQRQPSFTCEELRAIVSEARRFQMPTCAHVHCTAAIENCVDAGVDCLEHLGFYDAVGCAKVDPDVIGKMARAGTYACVTVMNSFLGIQRLSSSKDEASRRRLMELEQEFSNRTETLKECRKQGVQLVTGTDSIWEFGDYHIALQVMHDIGIPAIEVLRISTIDSARALRMGDVIGTIEPGKCADMVGFDDDPSARIESIANPCFVMKGGKTIVAR
jgi:imidazolonepropionase-like amidohydrolase